MKYCHSFERGDLLQSLHNNRQDDHSWGSHRNSRHHNLRNSLGSCQPALAHHIPVLVLYVNAVDQLVLTHQWNIDAISGGHSGKWHVSLDERGGGLLPIGLAEDCCQERTGRGRNIGDHHLINSGR